VIESAARVSESIEQSADAGCLERGIAKGDLDLAARN
jgi:hypothetical protein